MFFYLEETKLGLELDSQKLSVNTTRKVPYHRLTIYPNRLVRNWEVLGSNYIVGLNFLCLEQGYLFWSSENNNSLVEIWEGWLLTTSWRQLTVRTRQGVRPSSGFYGTRAQQKVLLGTLCKVAWSTYKLHKGMYTKRFTILYVYSLLRNSQLNKWYKIMDLYTQIIIRLLYIINLHLF